VAGGEIRELWLLHGVNLDMLGARPAEHYGTGTLADLEARVVARGAERGFVVRCFQTNHEGELVEKLHELALSPPADGPCGRGAPVRRR
jgi:3-dehydroquinate dehydratase-2